MNKELTTERLQGLLNLLEENKISPKDFYRLIELDNDTLSGIIKILNIGEIEEKDLLLDQLITSKGLGISLIYHILKSHPKIKDNIQMRNFIIENSKNYSINETFAKLIEYDFIFEDKELLTLLLDAKRSPYMKFTLANDLETLKRNIETNLYLYMDGSKNDAIKQALKMTNNKHRHYLIDLIEICEKLENDKWYSYFVSSCKQNESFNIETITLTLPKILESKRKEEVNACLLELDEKEIEENEKLKLFSVLSTNLATLDSYVLLDNHIFSYMKKHIFENPEDFRTYLTHIDLFMKEDPLSCEESKLQKAIFQVKNQEIRDELCCALKTTLANFITADFIKEQANCEVEEVSINLEKLAIKHQAIDYLEKYVPEYMEKEVDQELVEYLENNPNLTKEELLKLKNRIKLKITSNDKIILEYTNQHLEPTEKIEDKSMKGHVKRICQKIFFK